jgi:hypothetical protein
VILGNLLELAVESVEGRRSHGPMGSAVCHPGSILNPVDYFLALI